MVLFAEPLVTLGRDWWSVPEAQHGLLLFPVAVYLSWRAGLASAAPRPVVGLALLALAVVVRYLSGLAAELFTMRGSMLVALCGLIVGARGTAQLRRWWLPLVLVALSIPIPAVVLGAVTFALQLKASALGAAGAAACD